MPVEHRQDSGTPDSTRSRRSCSPYHGTQQPQQHNNNHNSHHQHHHHHSHLQPGAEFPAATLVSPLNHSPRAIRRSTSSLKRPQSESPSPPGHHRNGGSSRRGILKGCESGRSINRDETPPPDTPPHQSTVEQPSFRTCSVAVGIYVEDTAAEVRMRDPSSSERSSIPSEGRVVETRPSTSRSNSADMIYTTSIV